MPRKAISALEKVRALQRHTSLLPTRLLQQSRESGTQWARRGSAAIAAGDLDAARDCFLAAIRAESKNAKHRLYLGIILESLGERDEAAHCLTMALRLDPSMVDAGRRLANLLAAGVLGRDARLDSHGLKAALAIDRIDRDLIAAAALHHIAATTPFRQFIDSKNQPSRLVMARKICFEKASEFLRIPLLVDILKCSPITRPDVEALLTAIRSVIFLEMPVGRLRNSDLAEFVAALVRQGWLNEFVWGVTAAERDKLATLQIDRERLAAGDVEMCHAFLLACLYRPPEAVLGAPMTATEIGAVAPGSLASALRERQAQTDRIRELGASLPELSEVTDETSRKVAGQYEASPYPRWTSVALHGCERYLDQLSLYFEPGRLAFAKAPFEVLIAGCGTGQQAISAAFDYGPNARVTAFDITRASLGYAAMMAERLQAPNLALARGDLNLICEFQPSFAGRFKVVECGGVLHHLAQPFEAWRKLSACLAPGGIMLIGLYSRTARRSLELLRQEPSYPGPAADDDALRDYRQHLIGRAPGRPGSEYVRSRDFYTTSGFRDFFLHVNEHTTTLGEIAAFLEANGLEFRGFVQVPFEALQSEFPDAVAPGSLAQWAAWEERHPGAFSGMYQFFCSRA